jgi:tetratricopeptide (TPR) repeat protein
VRLLVHPWRFGAGVAGLLAALAIAPAAVAETPAAPAAAPAEPSADARKALAQKYLANGIKLFERKQYKDAIDAFLEANRLFPSPTLSFNAAKAYEKMGDKSGALRFYRDYLRRRPDVSDRADVQEKIAELERALQDKGIQQVTVRSKPEGALVLVDERPVGVTPWTGELVPGVHALRLRHEGYEDNRSEFELLLHRAMDVSVELTPQAGTPPPERVAPPVATPPPIEPASPPPTAGKPASAGGGVGVLTWTAFGLGAAAFGGALVFELQRASAEEDVKNERTRVDRLDAHDRMENHERTSRILAGVGAGLVVAGGVLLYFDLSGEQQASGVEVGLGCGPLGCGAAARGAW